MTNRAAQRRAIIQADHPGAIVTGGNANTIRMAVGGKQIVSTSPHYHYRNRLGWRDIDTEIVDDSGVFDHQDKDALAYRFKMSDAGRRRIMFRRDVPGEFIEFEPVEVDNAGWTVPPHGASSRVDNRLQWEATNWGVGYDVRANGVKAIYVAKSPLGALDIRWEYTLTGCTISGNDIISDLDASVIGSFGAGSLKDSTPGLNPIRRSVPVAIDATHITLTPDYTGLTFPVQVDPTVVIEAGVGADDGRAREPANDFDDGEDDFDTGRFSENDIFGWVRFPAVDVAKDETIASAFVTLVKSLEEETAHEIVARIHGIAEDDHAAPTDYSSWSTDHGIHTTANTAFVFTSAEDDSTETPDVTAIIQEIIDRGSWVAGNDIGLHIDEDGTDDDGGAEDPTQRWGDVEGGDPAELTIVYSVLGPQISDFLEQGFDSDSAHLVTMPATVVIDDLLLVFIAMDNQGAVTITTPSGWSEIFFQENGGVIYGIYGIKADGTEGGTTVDFVSSEDESAASHLYRIGADTWDKVLGNVEVGTAATGNGFNPNPPNLDPAGGAVDGLWIASFGSDAGGGDSATAFPTMYTGGSSIVSTEGSGDSMVASARRWLNADSEDPGAFTKDSDGRDWIVQTLFIAPAATLSLPAHEDWNAGSDEFWRVSTGADLDWIIEVDRVSVDHAILSGEGQIDGMDAGYNKARFLIANLEVDDVEVLFEWTDNDMQDIVAILRQTASDTYYIFGHSNDNSLGYTGGDLAGGEGWFIGKYVGGVFTVLAEEAVDEENGDFWIRAQIVGDALKLKHWEEPASEPGAWDLETTDSAITDPGLLGLAAGGVAASEILLSQFDATAPAGGTDHTETATDDVGVTDSTARVAPAVRSVTDPVGVTDSTTVAKTITVEITEAVGVTDSTTRIAPAIREITESIAVQDDTSDDETNRETLTESVGVTDSTTPVKTITVEITEAIGVTDSTAPIKSSQVEITDAVGVTSFVRNAFEISLGGTADPGDDTRHDLHTRAKVQTGTATLQLELRQGSTVIDAFSQALSTTETEYLFDVTAASITDYNDLRVYGYVDEGATGQTRIQRIRLALPILVGGDTFETATDPVGVTDSTTLALTIVRPVIDAVGVTDSTTPVKTIQIEIIEAVGVTDAITKATTIEISDDVGVTDITTRVAPAVRIITEGVAVSDVISDSETNRETSTEPVGVTDPVSRVWDIVRVVGGGSGQDPVFNDAVFLWDPAVGETRSHDLVADADSDSGVTDGSTVTSPRDGRVYDGTFGARFVPDTGADAIPPDQEPYTFFVAFRFPSGVTGVQYPFGGGLSSDSNSYASIAPNTSAVSETTWNANGANFDPDLPTIDDTDIHIVFVTVDGVANNGTVTNFFDSSTENASEGPSGSGVNTMNWYEIGRRVTSAPPESSGVEVFAAGVWDRVLSSGDIQAVLDNTYSYLGTDGADPVGVTDSVVAAITKTRTISDDVGVTDDTTPIKTIPQTLVDPVGVTDSTTRVHDAERVPVEAVGVTDSITPVKSITVEITEAVGVTDLVETRLALLVQINESIGVTDSTTRIAPAFREITEAVAVQDAVSDSETNRETQTEPVGVTDSTTRIHTAVRAIVEPVGVTDLIVTAKAIVVEITEAVGVTDLIVSAKTTPVEITDSVGVTDSTLPVKAIAQSIVEALGVTDSTTPVKSITVAITDDVDVTDSTTFDLTAGLTEAVTDPVGATDSTTRVHNAERVLVEAVGITDATTSAKTITIEITEAVGVTDDTPSVLGIVVAISDDVGVTDTTTRVAPAVREVTEGVAVQDAVSDSETNRETQTEPVGVTDTPVRVHTAFRSQSDDVGVTDLVQSVKAITVEITEAIGVTDLVASAKTVTESIVELVGVTDDTTPVKSSTVEITEAVGVTDDTADALSAGLTETASDDVGVTDLIAVAKTIQVTITDAVGVTDLVVEGETNIETVVESVGVTDLVTSAKAITIEITDAVGVTDIADDVLFAGLTETATDPVGVTDSTSRVWTIQRTITEAIGVTDLVIKGEENFETVIEVVGVTDSTLAAKSIAQSTDDDVGVTDSTLPAKAITVEITETVGVQDDTARAIVGVRSIIESVNVTDTIVRDVEWARIVDDNIGVTDFILAIDQAPSTLIPYSAAISDEPIADVTSREPIRSVTGKSPADIIGKEF